MKKLVIIIVSVLFALIVLGGIAAAVLIPSVPDYETFAFVQNVQGEVELERNDQLQPMEKGMRLEVADRIITKQGSVELVLYNKAVVLIDANTMFDFTQLTSEQILLRQSQGSIFTKFTRVLGTESYAITTPNAVASIRGTGFVTDTDSKTTNVSVDEGTVGVVGSGEEQAVTPFEVSEVLEDGTVFVREMTQEEKARLRAYREQLLNHLKERRWEMIQNAGPALGIVKRMYAVSDEDIQEVLADIDAGELDPRTLAEQAPMEFKITRALINLCDQIQNAQEELSMYQK